jgi:predicted amidohydrolase YtcJ
MEPLNPLQGTEEAVTREGLQKIPVFEALQMYTVFAAQSASEFVDKGTIEQNKFADLVVLSNDPTSITVKDLVDISVCFTIIGGIIYCPKN